MLTQASFHIHKRNKGLNSSFSALSVNKIVVDLNKIYQTVCYQSRPIKIKADSTENQTLEYMASAECSFPENGT